MYLVLPFWQYYEKTIIQFLIDFKMKGIAFIVAYIGISTFLIAQEKDLEFSLLRQNDNIFSLNNIENKTLYQRLKQVKIADLTTLSFGGSVRFQYESFVNEQFEKISDQDNNWFLNRILLHAHLKINNHFEVFTELNNSLIIGKDEISPVDKDILAVNQLFVKYNFKNYWNINIGRNNLKLGSGRLVDVREGPNVRRSFDMVQINYNNNKFSAKGFFSTVVKPKIKVFDNDFLKFDETFSGLYTTTNFSQAANIDAYLFYQKDDNVTYNSGTANERRSTLGIRHFGTYKTLSYNNELVYQFGSFGKQNIVAWTFSFQLENKTTLFNKSFNIGVKTEIISGDKNSDDNKLSTFDALYPRGAYFGRVARFGPSNLIDIHPYLNVQLKKLYLEVDYDVFWRQSKNDGVYNAALLLEYPDTNNDRFIANQIGAILGYELNNHISIELESNIILPGDFLKKSNKNDNLFHLVFTTEIKL